MKIKFDLRKSVNENAGTYFNTSKKLKGKIDGMDETISNYKKQLSEFKEKKEVFDAKEEEKRQYKERKQEWFEKFRWFYTSKNHLVVGGRDASTNEMIVKKHMDDSDLVFHTDMAGSPFFILKLKPEEKASEEEIREVSTTTACYSRAWKLGLTQTQVFYVKPEQVTKEANAGENLPKGSFMIRGKTLYADHEMKLALYVDSVGRVIGCSRESVPEEIRKAKKYVLLSQGTTKTSDAAKQAQKRIGAGLVDDFVRSIPPGGVKVNK